MLRCAQHDIKPLYGQRSNSIFFNLLKLGLTISILMLAARYVHTEKLLTTISTIRINYLAFAFILLVPNLSLQYFKWRLLLRQIDPNIKSVAAWHSLLAGFPLGLVTPGRWGEIGRAIFLPGYPRLAIAGLAAIDKITNFASIVILGCAGSAFLLYSGFLAQFPSWRSWPLSLVPLASCLLLFSPALVKRAWRRVIERGDSSSWLAVLKNFDAKLVGKLSVLSFLFVLTFSLQLVILVCGLHPVPPGDGMAAAFTTFFIQSLLPLSIGDLGIRESAAAFFFGKLGVAPNVAFDAGLTLFIINMLLPSALGLFLLWKKKPPSL